MVGSESIESRKMNEKPFQRQKFSAFPRQEFLPVRGLSFFFGSRYATIQLSRNWRTATQLAGCRGAR